MPAGGSQGKAQIFSGVSQRLSFRQEAPWRQLKSSGHFTPAHASLQGIESLPLHRSVMWPIHGTGLIWARCAGFLFQGGRTEKWRQRSSSHFLPPLSAPLHRPCSRRVYQAKHLVCSTRSPRKNTRASPSLSTLRCVRCKPKARRTSIRELSAMRPARF